MNIKPSNIFVVVPAYNEEKMIGAVIQALLQCGYSVVVVNDGSKDSTWNVIQNYPVYALCHLINLGQGAALQTGTCFAVQQGAKIVVHFDADGQHTPADIAVMVQPILDQEADVVLGSRFLRSSDAELVPYRKRFVLSGAKLVNWLFTGVRLTDAHNGLRALSADSAKKIELHESGFSHASEILIQIRHNHLRCIEKPTTITYSEYARAKGQPISNAFNILIDLFLRRLFR